MSDDKYVRISVGEVMPGWRPGLPERIQFDFTNAGGHFLLAYNNPTEDEIRKIKTGKIKMGITSINGLAFMLIKFGHLDWSDAPYYVRFSKPYKLGEVDDKTSYLVTAYAMDNLTGIVKVIRAFAMPPNVARRFKKIVEQQRELIANDGGLDDAGYDHMLAETYRNYSTPRMVAMGFTEEVEKRKK